MANLERRMIIPGSEKELMEAKAGDEIKISYPGNGKMESKWTLLGGNDKAHYTFIGQNKSKFFGEESSVVKYTCPLDKIQFDNRNGATLNHLYYNVEFFSREKDETYGAMVQSLKNANLWFEDMNYAIYNEGGDTLLGFVTNETLTAMGRIPCRNFKTKLISLEKAKEIRNAYEKGLK